MRIPPDPPSLYPVRVLFVEDDLETARLFARRLRWSPAARFEVTHFPELDAALGALERLSFDVALVDVGLPDADGMGTVAAIGAVARHVPIVFLTANDDDALAVDAVRAGAQDYLIKQHSDGRTVARALLQALHRHRRERPPAGLRSAPRVGDP